MLSRGRAANRCVRGARTGQVVWRLAICAWASTLAAACCAQQAVQVPWTPSRLADLALWLDAADAATITLNGNAVSQWNDKSGFGRDAVQAAAGSQPTFTPSGLNGKPVLSFDGASDFLASTASLPSLSSGVSIFCVAQNHLRRNYNGILRSPGVLQEPSNFELYWQAGSGNSGNFLYAANRTAKSLFRYWQKNSAGPLVGNPYLGGAVVSGAQDARLFMNGMDLSPASQTPSTGTLLPQQTGTFAIGVGYGAYGNIGSTSLNGYIAELVLVPWALASEDRQKLEGYLAHKWGLAGNLPADHPYKTAAPTVDVSPLVHWKLDETSGSTAYDVSGNGRHGTYVAVQLADEAPHPAAGAAPRFDGVTSYVNLGTVNASFAQGFSLALWAKPTSPASNERLLELASDAAGTNRMRLQRNGAAGELAFGLQNSGDSVRIIGASNALETQRWQHYVATIRADGHAVLYVNGQPVASGALALPASVSRAVCHLGAAAAQTNKFAGNLADFRLYDYPLTHAEVADLYGLVGWYRCEETSGSVAVDSSGKENHAAVVGSGQWSAGLKEGSGALRLDGASYLRVDSIPLGGPHAAIAGWAKLESVDGLGADLANLGEHLVLRLDETTNGRGTTALGYSGAGYGMASSQRFYEAAGWRHYAAVLDGVSGEVALYLDGVKRGTAPAATGLTFRELVNRVTFGAATNGASDYRLQGWVDDLRIYSRPLSTAEIRTLYFGKFNPGPRIIEWREVE